MMHKNWERNSIVENAQQHTKIVVHLSASAKHNNNNLVLIHGWGFSSQVWQPLILELNQHFNLYLVDLPGYGTSAYREGDYELDTLLHLLLEALPERALYCGWSLGANIILQLAHIAAHRVQAIISLASNPCFVQSADWPGVDAASYASFVQKVQLQGENFLPRFAGLCVKGAAEEKQLLVQLKQQLEEKSAARDVLLASLLLTAHLDSRALLASLTMPQCYVLAMADVLSNADLLDKMRQHCTGADVVYIDQAPHALFLSHTAKVLQYLLDFCKKHQLIVNRKSGAAQKVSSDAAQQQLDKQSMIASFNRAAPHYNAVAHLQKNVVNTLLPSMPLQFAERIVDLGCGTGLALPGLQRQYPAAKIFAVDIAANMLMQARAASTAHANRIFIRADFDQLPFAAESLDIIFSSLAMQWSDNLNRTLQACNRVLKPQGHCVVSSLLSDTLCELRLAWQCVDALNERQHHVHVNQFLTERDIRCAIAAAGFELLHLWREKKTYFYVDVVALMRELKQLGAHNVNHQRPRGLTGRRAMQQLQQAYAQHQTAEGIPATYDLVYMCLKKCS